jgi:hypothetical protein
MQRLFSCLLLGTMIAGSFMRPGLVVAEDASLFNPHYLLSDAEMLDVDSMSLEQIQVFLSSRGTLGDYRVQDIDGVIRSASEIIYNASQAHQISPRFLMVLLQREQSLVDSSGPTERQLDWAMGYAICDSCSKDDPRLQKYKGFAQQVWYAAERIRTSYLNDLESRGFTLSGIGPGREVMINGTIVVPVNFATASLYTYTPHLHGNKNFVRIWDRWFTRHYLNGTLLQDSSTGDVWLIQHGLARPITSQSAFYSRFDPSLVIPVSTSEILKYDQGAPISFANYSLLRSPTGVVYLIVDDERHGFVSQEAFRAIGFSPDEIIDVSWEDLDPYTEGSFITVESIYPQGGLLQDRSTGGVVYVENGIRHAVHSREILQSRFAGRSIVPVTSEDLQTYEQGLDVTFPDGTLVAVNGSPDVFVISDGQRRPIADETAFLLYGWKWDQIIWTNERSVLLHPLGEVISSQTTDEDVDLELASN